MLGAMLCSVRRLLMRDGTIQSGKIYIFKWIKVRAALKPASEAQINLSSLRVGGGGGGGGSP